jgi:hypothetical protein
MPDLEIIHTHEFDEARRRRDAGYEPVECAFGQYGSVLGPLELDHHGTESHREGVALRACRDLYGARAGDPRFVVTGTPDADAVLAIVALAGLVPKDRLRPEFYEMVDRHDVDPIGLDMLDSPPGEELAWFNQRSELFQNEAGFRKAVGHMVDLLRRGLTEGDRKQVHKMELNRRKKALDGVIGLYDLQGRAVPLPEAPMPLRRGRTALSGPGRVLLVKSTVWGFDQWYRMAPLVVSYAERMAKTTVGCPDTETAELLLGPGGLMTVWPRLGRGWGGRSTIGGSPRGARHKVSDAEATARALVTILREKTAAAS